MPTPPTTEPTPPANEEQSGTYVYPDTGAAGSQRLRKILAKRGIPAWWTKHAKPLMAVELILSIFFLLLAGYYLSLWLSGSGEAATLPAEEWRVSATPGRWTQIVVHHTGTEGGTPEAFDKNHREVRKWENGLGYHFLIGNGKGDSSGRSMGDGEVHVGRRWREQLDGAHVVMKGDGKANSFSIGIALVGNFGKTSPTPAQVTALRVLLAFLTTEYAIAPERVVGHGAVSARHTDCPGENLRLRISEIAGAL